MSEQISDRRGHSGGRSGLLERVQGMLPARFRRGTAVVPVVRLSAVIGAVTPLRPGMTLAGVAKMLERAFGTRNAKAVALVINSPGGSPVQSRQIYLRIRQLAAEKKLPVLVFAEDVAASGGYMIACAGDEIYCDPSSILGSIGVVAAAVAVLPALRSGSDALPLGTLGLTLAGVLVSGLVFTVMATAWSLRGRLLDSLRNQ